MQIPSVYCPSCQSNNEPNFGYIQGSSGLTDQIGFWCKWCGQQMMIASQWQDPTFAAAVYSRLNPFSSIFPSLRERMDNAIRPRTMAPNTLYEARNQTLAKLDEGVDCPCCYQFAKRSIKTFNSKLAVTFVRLACNGSGSLTDKSKAKFDSECETIKLWGLIEKSESGWVVTDRGSKFLNGDIKIPKKAVVYNGNVERFELSEVNMNQALGKKYNLNDYMSQKNV